MKRILFAGLLILLACNTYAKKKEKNLIDGEYNRNSISFVVVNHGDSYDAEVNESVRTYINDKFDFNDIDIKTVQTSVPRIVNPGAAKVMPPKAKDISSLL